MTLSAYVGETASLALSHVRPTQSKKMMNLVVVVVGACGVFITSCQCTFVSMENRRRASSSSVSRCFQPRALPLLAYSCLVYPCCVSSFSLAAHAACRRRHPGRRHAAATAVIVAAAPVATAVVLRRRRPRMRPRRPAHRFARRALASGASAVVSRPLRLETCVLKLRTTSWIPGRCLPVLLSLRRELF